LLDTYVSIDMGLEVPTTVELYACDGKYEAYHDESTEGCGTVFLPGAGQDDIHEKTFDLTTEGVGVNMQTAAVKEYCPVCGLNEVVVVKAADALALQGVQ
jgi:hypothetical protein